MLFADISQTDKKKKVTTPKHA